MLLLLLRRQLLLRSKNITCNKGPQGKIGNWTWNRSSQRSAKTVEKKWKWKKTKRNEYELGVLREYRYCWNTVRDKKNRNKKNE